MRLKGGMQGVEKNPMFLQIYLMHRKAYADYCPLAMLHEKKGCKV
jgi:hypothetical protein